MPRYDADTKGYGALLVDDSNVARLVMGRALEALGFRVSLAADGRQALELLESNGCYDLALIDWNMPGMAGPELVRVIRSRPEFAGLTVILVSATEDSASRAEALVAGSDDYLAKPFTGEELSATLGELGFDA
jgi:CheY-like chemotaxis protein